MKDGWKIVKLGKCFSSINNGANIKQIKGAQGFPITRIETLSNDKFNRDRMGYADIYDYSKYSNYILNDGDILMSHINSMKFLGRSVLYNKINNETIIHGMNLLRLVPITNLILCSYVNYYFSTKSFKEQIQGISHQSVNQASFNVTSLKNLDVILPPLEEQYRIVSILDASFEKIDALKKNAEENLKNAKALFQQVLAQELKPKDGWVEKKFENIVVKNEVGLVKNSKEQSIEYKYPYLKMGNITSSNYLDMSSIVNVNATEDEVNRYSLVYGDFLFNTRNSKELVGKSCVYNRNDEICLYNNNIIRFNFINEINPFFINYLFSNTNIKEQLEKIKKGTTNVWAIYYKELRDIIINIPSLETQHRIVRTLDTLSEKCRRLEEVAQQTIRECDALKQSILRQAFSGEL